MTLKELYQLKIYEYKNYGYKERPHKLLAMLLLDKLDKFEPLNKSQGEFYKKYKKIIDEAIKKVETDFNFTKKEMIEIIEETVICDNYKEDKVWYVFSDGFSVINWCLRCRKDKTPEEIYSEYYESDDLKKPYDLKEKVIANNINSNSLKAILDLIIDKPVEFYTKISDNLTLEEKIFILDILENKSCINCTNENCRFDRSNMSNNQTTNCLGWYNPELVGRAKVLNLTNINKLK